ncbi:MAG: PQQ-binding-like beta-propeller repeat protein [Candidatus Bathyarchaeia archaeon]
MKNILVKLVTLALCFTLAFSSNLIKLGFCQTALQVQPGYTEVQVCTNFEISIAVTDVYDLFGFDIKLAYDTNVMDALNIEILPPFNGWPIILTEIHEEEGWLWFGAAIGPLNQPFSGSGLLANVTFHCTAESTASALHLFDDHLFDPYNEIPHSSQDGFVAQYQPPAPPINVTFRILAVEHFYSNALSFNFEAVGTQDYAMKSGQYLIQTLLGYNNWVNNTVSKGFKFTAYVHLLSNHSSATSLSYYRGPPTNSNVVNEIQNFLAATEPPWENNTLTIRIFYYVGHSGITNTPPPGSIGGFFLALGERGCHPANPQDPTNPSSYEELWDYQLNQTLNHGDLATNNCTLIILDSCRSGGAIQSLRRPGRVILTACSAQQLANGWVNNPATWPPGTRDRWSWFTGQNIANSFFKNGTNAGPLGIIGAIASKVDVNNDGWLDVGEIFPPANGTTVRYANAESMTQVPEKRFGVIGGKIPIVQINTTTPFPYNGKPSGLDIEVEKPWPGFHDGPDRTGTTFGEGASLGTPLWTRTGIGMNASIVTTETEAIAAAKNGSVYGLDLATGDIIWKFNAESQIHATPYADKGIIYVATLGGGGGGGGAGGILYAIDEATTRVIWQTQALPNTGFYASPVVADGYVFVATTSETGGTCMATAFNQTTGEMLWSRLLETPAKSSPAVKNGLLFIATTTKGSEPARLHAFSEFSGTDVWTYSFGLSEIISTPTVAAGRVIIGCGGGGGGGALPGVYAFNALSGSPAWEFVTSGPVTSSPAVHEEEGFVAVCCQNGFVYTLSLTEGTPIGSALIDPNKSSPAISGDGYIYVGSSDGNLYRLNKWCETVDSYDTNSQFYDISSPALIDNHLIIGYWDILTIYCFGSPWPEHDVAVKEAFPQQTEVNQGDPVTIEYTIKNEGNVAENVTVTVGYFNTTTPPFGDSNPLYVDTFQLDADTETTRTYKWYTTSMPAGTYNVSAIVHIISGETDVVDNILVNGTVRITELGVHDVAVTSVTPSKTVVCQTMT